MIDDDLPGDPPLDFVLATNAYGGVKPYYCLSLAATYRHFAVRGWRTPDFGMIEGVYTPWARNVLLDELFAASRHHDSAGVLWVEQDHAWHPEDVEEVLRVAAGHPRAVVGASYLARQSDRVIGEPVVSIVGEESSVARAEYVGFGFTFTPWTVFEAISHPWFETGSEPGPDGRSAFVSCDVDFCRKVTRAGYEILVATRARIGHAHEPGPRLASGEPYR